MGRFVNPDNSAFQVALNSPIYVDKTGLLEYTNSVLNTTEAISVTADHAGLENHMLQMNNPVPVSLLSGDRKPQIRFLGNHHSGSGNLYHKSFRM